MPHDADGVNDGDDNGGAEGAYGHRCRYTNRPFSSHCMHKHLFLAIKPISEALRSPSSCALGPDDDTCGGRHGGGEGGSGANGELDG
mmetsp:Transcript_28549/g.55512  ORF Transcript_28549/g.55512 Transcript_28549/m.55512 type:complete len:87 (+) Transcript_28549:981-1241(+)